MKNTAEAVVIGGGAIGASTAFHLSKLGLKHVVLCERRTLAGAATGKSAAHIQIGESPEAEARITIASLPYYLHWDEMVGAGSCGFKQTGYMRIHPVSNLTQSQGNAERARALGIDARILDAAQVRDVAPYLAIADDEHAHFQPLAGHASSTGTTFGFAEGAQRLGAEVAEHVAVEEILTHGAQVTGVRTSVGTISTPVVVVAAGAWTALMLASHGLDLPVRIVRTQVAVFSWPAGATAFQIMSVSDAVDGYSYFSSEGVGDKHVIIGLGRRGHSPLEHLDSYDEEGDPSYATAARERLATRVPSTAYIRGAGGWAGPVTVTPDKAPLIDAHPSVSGLFFATGCNGTGFKGSPAVGRALAEWATIGAPQYVDLTPFRAARFASLAAGRPVGS